LIYGATGFTGHLIARQAIREGLRPLLAGRDERKLAALAEQLELPYRVTPLEPQGWLDTALRDVDVVLNAAGPFLHTAGPLADACVRTATHYLDVTGEVPVIELLSHRDAAARRAGVLVMPAIGFDVVPSDCLAAHLGRRLPEATHLAVGIRGLGFLTRGSARSFLEYADQPIRVRRDGALLGVAPGELERLFDFGDGERPCCAVSWGDVATAYYTTGIPNVETYLEATPQLRASLLGVRAFGRLLGTPLWQTWMKALADMRREGPSDAERAAAGCVIVAEAAGPRGGRAVSRLHTPEAYTTTALCAVRVAAHVLKGDLEPGFQTAGRLYGPDFVMGLPGMHREDVDE
jgi:short subunit dehydrogenase-like uncharacterized protein